MNWLKIGKKEDLKLSDGRNNRRKKGSALMTVMMIGTGLLLVAGVTLNWSVTEKRLNIRHVLRVQAKNASESIVEYGFAELIARFVGQTSFPINELQTRPLKQPTAYSSFYADSEISTNSSDTILTGGVVPPGEWRYIDPADPVNDLDPMKGKRVFVREIEVFGKATAEPSGFGGDLTAYTMQRLQVRDAPLFGHAVFYNMDLEMHSGSTMTISGPIHSNTDIWMEANSSGPLNLTEGVSSAGRIMHGEKKRGITTKTGPVYIKDSGGTSRNMYNGGSTSSYSSWLDHRDAEWREKSVQRWDGMAQDSAHQVHTLNPLGIDDYVPDNPYTTGVNELENHAYSVIEPVLPTAHVDYKDDAVRKQKFAYKAGLIVSVTGNGRVGIPANSAPPVAAGSYVPNSYTVKAYRYQRTNPDDPTSAPVLAADGTPVRIELKIPDGVFGAPNSSLSSISSSDTATVDDYQKNSSGRPIGGMFDHRQDKALDILAINVGKLKDAVEDNDAADWDPAGTGGSTYKPEKWWNGVTYVEFPTVANSGGRVDKIVKGNDVNVALMTINAKQIPDPYLTNTNFVAERGWTLATNNPLYSMGHFNANGTGANSVALDSANEPPAALVADTFTVLSSRYGESGRGRQRSADGSVSSSNRPTYSTEISAAILTGLAPTVPQGAPGDDGSSSGGLHNFPRFIEYWSGKTLTIRGSLVSLFQSEVHPGTRPSNYTHYYRWPSRNFGFSQNFRDGNYPPGSPNARTFRRTAFKDLTEAEYTTAINSLWTGP